MSNKFFTKFLSNAIIFAFISIFTAFSIISIPVNSANASSPMYKGEDSENCVYITFSVSNSCKYLMEIAEILDQYDAKATFFISGKLISENEKVVKELFESGNGIENYGFLNRNFSSLSVRDISAEIRTANSVIERITGCKSKFFTPPGGILTENIALSCQEVGVRVVMWSVDSMDGTGASRKEIIYNVTSKLSSGDIIRFHSTENTLYALADILFFCNKNGFNFKILSQSI